MHIIKIYGVKLFILQLSATFSVTGVWFSHQHIILYYISMVNFYTFLYLFDCTISYNYTIKTSKFKGDN